MTDSSFYGTVLVELLHRHEEHKVTIEFPEGSKAKNTYLLNGEIAILIKYTSDLEGNSFNITESESSYLRHFEEIYPRKTYLILTNGKKLNCSLSIDQINQLCDLTKKELRSITIKKIDSSGLFVKGSLGQLSKNLYDTDYLNFI